LPCKARPWPTLPAVPLPSRENWWDWVPALVAAYVIGHFLLGLGVPLNSLAAAVYPEAKDHYFQEVRNQDLTRLQRDRQRPSRGRDGRDPQVL
jgi:hypothetical protein